HACPMPVTFSPARPLPDTGCVDQGERRRVHFGCAPACPQPGRRAEGRAMAANDGDVASSAQPRKTSRRAAMAARAALAEVAYLDTRDSGASAPVAQPLLLTNAREQPPVNIARAPRPRRRAATQRAAEAAASTVA